MSRRAVLGRAALWVALALGLSIMWGRYGAATATTLLTIISGGAALAQLVTALRWRSRQDASSTSEQLDRASEALAWEVRTQWEAEAGRRLLDEADGLPLRWEAKNGSATGDLAELVTSYADAPRRLVVIGDPGSGKTGLCMLLTLELLRRPSPSRAPVLLQISSWNPSDDFHAWLIRSILEFYPFLGNEARYGATAVRDLLAQHRILPVLDGLDEMAEDRRTAALQTIGLDRRSGEPLVLTSRTAEFEATGIVRDALVVRLLPLTADIAAEYLLDVAPTTKLDRWDPVLAQLTEDDGGPVAEALRTPLMLYLARTAYADPSTTPAELLELPDARQVEEHLLDAFAVQVFAYRPPSALATASRPSRHWDPAKAERWLAALARMTEGDIAWWRLYRAVPKAVFIGTGMLVGGGACTLLGWLMFGLFGRPGFGALLGLAVGLTGGLALGLVPTEAPRRFVPRMLRRSELTRDLGFGLIGAVVGGLVVGILYGGGFGIAIGLVFGIAFGVVRRFTEPTEPREAVTPASVMRSDRFAVLYAAGLGGLVGALVGAFMGGVVGAATRGLVVPIDNPVLVGLLGAAVGALLGAFGLALIVQSTSASGRSTTTRVWLALWGVTPLRLMTFLDDARRLGVLRQVGPYYQFRHALLRDRLARRR
ncbi:NACHT domain-containing protein [Amycolatopsis sp. BJA-103]|uniref:NACHT domain-containing protein n=1 Tax=Amycolatopsis sp. BJA-103 TaxID=1911175 RepID=UPI0011AED566|nr:NACHT domain-containing protein [Amycolatopsis sp. BJA-103]